jgi:hypothetical protein
MARERVDKHQDEQVEAMATNRPCCKRSKQSTGNMGLYLVCAQLTKRGWNVLLTSRNARGVDLVAYSDDGERWITVQVKALTEPADVGLGNNLQHLMAQYVVIARRVFEETPEYFITRADKAKSSAALDSQYWLARKEYEPFRDCWEVIGDGFLRADTVSGPEVLNKTQGRH